VLHSAAGMLSRLEKQGRRNLYRECTGGGRIWRKFVMDVHCVVFTRE